MPNKNYIKGVRKERECVNQARRQGKLAFRSAGSHSPIDVVVIDKKQKLIEFIQCKPDTMNDYARHNIEQEQHDLNDCYICRFIVK
jgi:Holliday junction resolvase